MYIEPSTDIYILKDIPLDTTFEHTILFSSAVAQANWFISKKKYNLSNYSYQRVQRGSARVGIKAENLYDCNYLMFRNTAFGSKWFYAFIKSVEYVNNETSLITFTIDVMQTWHFDYALAPSFVEREHSLTDDPTNQNLVEENLDFGEYVFTDKGDTAMFDNYVIVVATSFEVNDSEIVREPAEGAMYQGIYSGLKYKTFTTASQCNEFLATATTNNKSDGIVSVFMMPSQFVSESNIAERHNTEVTKNVTIGGYTAKLDGYTPRNNKLLLYPYNFLHVVTGEGKTAEYKYEFFSSGNCTFDVVAGMSCSPEIMLYPKNYKGLEHNYNEAISMSNFPQCAYTIDAYRAWVASKGGESNTGENYADIIERGETAGAALGLVKSAVGNGLFGASLGALSGQPAGMLAGGAVGSYFGSVKGWGDVANTIGTQVARRTQPPSARGSQTSNVMLGLHEHDFHFYGCTITSDYARILDDFFDKYGYACKRNKVPNRNARQHWTYTKTIGCNINGSIPCDDADAICSIYDNGITFWNNGDEVGEYGLSNRPWGE